MHEDTHIPGQPETISTRPSPWDTYHDGIQVHSERRKVATARWVRERNTVMRALGEVVYAAQCGEVIKIGHTSNLAARLLQIGADELLAFRRGTRDDEQALHANLRDHVHHGLEWYYPTPGVMAVVNEMRESLGLAPVA